MAVARDTVLDDDGDITHAEFAIGEPGRRAWHR